MRLTTRLQYVAVITLSASLGAWAVACSSSSGNSTGNNPDSGAQGDAASSGDGTAGGDSSTGQDGGASQDGGADGTPDPDMSCYALSPRACGNCCSQHHQAGDQVFNDAFDMCICSASHCATQCAQTDCSMDPDAGQSMMGDPCDVCQTALLGDGGACTIAIDNACSASPDCVAFVHCDDTCP